MVLIVQYNVNPLFVNSLYSRKEGAVMPRKVHLTGRYNAANIHLVFRSCPMIKSIRIKKS
jgi:hypothetical protein